MSWKPDDPYDVILAKANEIGWPLHYRNDLLVHDRDALAEHDPALPFLWGIRECGTHLIFANRLEGRLSAEQITQAFGRDCRWFLWDGTALVPFEVRDYDSGTLDKAT